MVGTIEISTQEYKSLLKDKQNMDIILDSITDDIYESRGYSFNEISKNTLWLLHELFPAAMENLDERLQEAAEEHG